MAEGQTLPGSVAPGPELSLENNTHQIGSQNENGQNTRQNYGDINPGRRRGALVAAAGTAAPGRPVNDDEAQTHYHKQEADPSEDGCLRDTDRLTFTFTSTFVRRKRNNISLLIQ